MRKHVRYTVIYFLLILLIGGCSTSKNTWMSRNYQATHTRFNVFFNGAVSYKDGLKNIVKTNQDDYSSVIPMYPISKHSNATAATANMDRTMEKSRKAIKLHSIKKKPQKNYNKTNSPEYMRFYNQEEFNPQLKKAWMLLAQSEFHKGNFLGSAATFTYIAKHYSTETDVVTACQLWIARAYGEMGWSYEADQVISKLNQNDISTKNTGLYASVNADLLLKSKHYKEAIPFLKTALSKESDKDMKVRFSYLLGQLYQKNGDNKTAYDYFSDVIKSNPPYEMGFNARIARAQLDKGDVKKTRKLLRKMLKNKNNKEYLDQIYYAIASTYIQHNDTANAIVNYKLSAKESTRNGINKAVTLITLGDLYYKMRNYVAAQPCYDAAGKIITKDHDDYPRVTKLAETLGELVVQNDIVVLQDSLQGLAKLSEKERLDAVNKIIAKMIVDEKAAAELTQEKQREDREDDDLRGNMGTLPPIGSNMAADWYFYNINLMRSGQQDFNKRWGKRKLEDNWRRTIKTSSAFADETSETTTNAANAASNDSVPEKTKTAEQAVIDNKKPEFYLKQIPVTPAQIEKSNAEIATALFNMGLIYLEKIEDYPLAVSTFETLFLRFPKDKRISDAYFQLYLASLKTGNTTEANLYKEKLIREFPDSKQAKILAQPDFDKQLASMNQEQDSIYSQTYAAYNKSDFTKVFENVAYVQKKYPLTPLMPKFMFLNALSIGKKESSEKFETSLNELVTKHPTSDVSAMAKDILALLKQGQKATTGTTTGTLIARREAETKAEIDNTIAKQQFSTERRSKHRLLLICNANTQALNKLQYQAACFNFSRFMIKDFDLVINREDSVNGTLSVTNFDSFDEVESYINSLKSDIAFDQSLNSAKAQKVIISEENYAVVKANKNMDEYLAFIGKPVAKKENPALAIKTSKKQENPTKLTNTQNTTIAALTPKLQAKTTDPAITKAVGKTMESPVVKADARPTEKTVATDKPKESTPQVINIPVSQPPAEKKISKAVEKTADNVEKAVNKLIAKATGKPTETEAPKTVTPTAQQPTENKTPKVTENKTETVKPVTEKTAEKQAEKPIAKTTEKLPEKTTTPVTQQSQEKNTPKLTEKTEEKVVVKAGDKLTPKAADKTAATATPKDQATKTTAPTVVTPAPQPKEPEVPLFKNLFGFKANEPQYVAIYVLSGTFDFEKAKTAIDAYNKLNYAALNLNVTLEKVNKQQLIMIGTMSDATTAKSYLLKMVKEKTLFETLKNCDYRNILGSKKNIDTMVQQNALSVYFEFMKEYYLK